jgi:hypothetical protein
MQMNMPDNDRNFRLRPATVKRRSLLFDARGYDPREWDELFESVAVALKAADLPTLYDEPWRNLGGGFLYTGPPDEAAEIESVLEQFAVWVVRE